MMIESPGGLRLNLGCNSDARPGFLNVDRCAPADFITDLSKRWPWKWASVDTIYAKDIFEHLDNDEHRGNRGKIWVMNEAWRVLKPGGLLEFIGPCVYLQSGSVNPGAFADPTHVSFWTYDDRYYFCEDWNNPQGERGRLGPTYGIECRFRQVMWILEEYGGGFERRCKIHAVLAAVK